MSDIEKVLNYTFTSAGGNILYIGEMHEYTRHHPDGREETVYPREHMDTLIANIDILKEKGVDFLGVESPPFMDVYFELYEQGEIEPEELREAVIESSARPEHGALQADFWIELIDNDIPVRGVNVRQTLEGFQVTADNPEIDEQTRSSISGLLKRTGELMEQHPEIAKIVQETEAFRRDLNSRGFVDDSIAALVMQSHMERFGPDANSIIVFGDAHRNGMNLQAVRAVGIMDDVLENNFRVVDAYIVNEETLRTMYDSKGNCFSYDRADWLLIADREPQQAITSRGDLAAFLDIYHQENLVLSCTQSPSVESLVNASKLDPSQLNPMQHAVIRDAFAKIQGGDDLPNDLNLSPELHINPEILLQGVENARNR